jgi:hypothetical protein
MLSNMLTLTICASVTSYPKAVEIKKDLEAQGFRVLVPFLAEEMERTGQYDLTKIVGETDNTNPARKRGFIDAHIAKIEQADALFILNYPKHGLDGYIGPNVLMELTIGYYLKKPLYFLYAPSSELPSFHELMALGPEILDGKLESLSRLKTHK